MSRKVKCYRFLSGWSFSLTLLAWLTIITKLEIFFPPAAPTPCFPFVFGYFFSGFGCSRKCWQHGFFEFNQLIPATKWKGSAERGSESDQRCLLVCDWYGFEELFSQRSRWFSRANNGSKAVRFWRGWFPGREYFLYQLRLCGQLCVWRLEKLFWAQHQYAVGNLHPDWYWSGKLQWQVVLGDWLCQWNSLKYN